MHFVFFAACNNVKRTLTKYKIPGGKKITLIDKEAVLAFEEYYSEWEKTFHIVPPLLVERNTLFGSDRGYDGEVKIANAFEESGINGILILNFSNKDQNNIIQSKSKLTFECDFILLTKDYGLWSVEVCDASGTRILKSISEKFEQLIKNRGHILNLAKELYGENFSYSLADIYNGIVAVPNATSDDFQTFKTTAVWQEFISSSPFHKIEFIGKEKISNPLSIYECITVRKLPISSTSADALLQFYATISLVKTSYRTLDLKVVLSKEEKRTISDASAGMNVGMYNVILSPEQALILKEMPTHLQIIGEAATGKTELLKAVAHMIFKYNSGGDLGRLSDVSSLAEGVCKILYFIFGDKPYLQKSIEGYFSLLEKNLKPSMGRELKAEVYSIAGRSIDKICDRMLEVLQTAGMKHKTFVLMDECYHRIESQEIVKYLNSCKGCWIATVLTGQSPVDALQVMLQKYGFSTRALRRVYRGTKGITLASSTLKLSSASDFPAYLANRFSYVHRYNDIEIKDITETTTSWRNENDSLCIVLRGKKGLETIEEHSVVAARERHSFVSQNPDFVNRDYNEELIILNETIDDQAIYIVRFSGAEWNSVIVKLDIPLAEFQTYSYVIYLLLSLCTSRASCKCLLMCQNDCREVLLKRLYPSTLLEAVRCRNNLNITDLHNKSTIEEFLSICPDINPLKVASGAYNIDFLQTFLKENDFKLSFDEIQDIFLCLTEPFPDQKLVSLTKVTMERYEFPVDMVFLWLHGLCSLQSQNKWHFELISAIFSSKCLHLVLSRNLIIALIQNHDKCAKHLIEAKADVNFKDENSLTPLTIASKDGRLDIVKYLVDAGADVNMKTELGVTPLMLAAKNGHLETVKYLMEANADINLTGKHLAPLSLAAQNGHLDIVKSLSEVHADVNLRDKSGFTPLTWAARNGHSDAVKYLIEAHADFSLQNEQGFTPLWEAVVNGNVQMVKYLIEAQTDVDVQNEDGDTLLTLPAYKGHFDVVKYGNTRICQCTE